LPDRKSVDDESSGFFYAKNPENDRREIKKARVEIKNAHVEIKIAHVAFKKRA
jgi:hypothetical protein